ncbi:hypothetical protein [Blastococcus montanus]|uniref:hypothetical protein n=1 Tax=Blastococcus montanus TaxID=3144973 RepID=UPI0032080CB4
MTTAPGAERTANPAELRGESRLPAPVITAAVLLGLAALAFIVGASAATKPFAPLALTGGLLLGVAIWWRPLVGVVVVAAISPALAGLSRGIGLPGLKLSELLVIVAAAALFIRRPPRWRRTTGVDYALAAFAITSVGFGLYHITVGNIPLLEGRNLGDAFLVTVQPTFLFLAWWAASRGVQQRSDVFAVLRWVLYVSLVPAVLGIMQYFDIPGIRDFLIVLTGNAGLVGESAGAGAAVPESFRVTGPFPIWHSFGGYLLLPMVTATVMLLRGDRTALPTSHLLVVLLIDAAALVLAVTVTLLLWLPIAVIVAALFARRLISAVVVLAVLATMALLLFPEAIADRAEQQTSESAVTAGLGGPDIGFLQTLQYRFLVWERDYLPVVASAAPVGLGTERVPGALFDATENQNLSYLLRGGIGLVVAAWVAMGAIAVRALRHGLARTNVARSGALAIVGVMSFLPAAAQVWPYVSNAGLSYALVPIAGAVLAIEPRRARTDRWGDAEPDVDASLVRPGVPAAQA